MYWKRYDGFCPKISICMKVTLFPKGLTRIQSLCKILFVSVLVKVDEELTFNIGDSSICNLNIRKIMVLT